MSYITYNIYKSSDHRVVEGVKELLRNVSLSDHPIRLVFFAACGDDYALKLDQINEVVKGWYSIKRPLVTLVAQRTLDCRMAVEIQSVSKQNLPNLEVKHLGGVRYSVLTGERSKMLFTEGATSRKTGVKEKSDDIFKKLRAIFDAEGIHRRDIDRQWNYIEDITGSEFVGRESRQKYQEFNDSRSDFYKGEDWSGGYPAATGIGTTGGGIIVELDAATKSGMRSVCIDNKLQVSAHRYSEEVLIGQVEVKSTPKFERARAIVFETVFGDIKAQVYISGTAAIRGEESLPDDVELQTQATLENIELLISKNYLNECGVNLLKMPRVQIFRVYLKRDEDLDAVRRIISRRYPTVSTLYVKSEVCREELLIEIEGIAE